MGVNEPPGHLDASLSSTAESDQAEIQSPPLRVGWVVGKKVIERFGETLRALAVGLMDELVELFAICPHDADPASLPSPPLEIIPHGQLRWAIFETRAVESLVGEIRAHKVQLLHAMDAGGVRLTKRLARNASLPYVVSSWALGDARRLHGVGDAAAILAGSALVRKGLLAHHVAPAEKIRLLRPGVHHAPHATCFKDPHHSIAIVAGGEMNQFAFFAPVLKSFAELRGRDRQCAFFLIGNGRAEKRLRAQAERLGLREDLTFADRPPSTQMPDIFEAADVYISPVPTQTVDTWTLLAMAGGVPVLAAADGSSDFLIDGETAMLFERGDAGDLTAKLTALLDDPRKAREQAERALSYLHEHHSAPGMVSELAKIYRESVL